MTFRAAPITPPPGNWEPAFRAVYALDDGQIVKFVPKPWISQRQGFYFEKYGVEQYNAIPAGPDLMLINFDGATFGSQGAMFGGPPDVSWAIRYVLQTDSWDLRGPTKLLHAPLMGDWVVRVGSTPEQRLPQLLEELSRQLPGPEITLTKAVIDREAIVIRGKLDLHPVKSSAPRGRIPIILYRGNAQPSRDSYGGDTFERTLADVCDMPVVLESTLDNARFETHRGSNVNLPPRLTPAQRDKEIDQILANLAKQTSLECKRETRVLPVWTLGSTGATTQPTIPH